MHHWNVRVLFMSLILACSGLQAGFEEGLSAYKNNDYARAYTKFLSLAKQGDADAQYSLGVMYANGEGVAKDDAQAVAWYRKAADQGNANAQNNLGVMYTNGEGVAKDDAQAVAWYRKAADQGNAIAQNSLGVRYDNGNGVAKDDAQAVAWYRKAADQGNANAQYNLGIMYANGEGVAKDDAQAVVWYRKAADQGYADAQNNLGAMYGNGYGIKRNYAWAIYWYAKAAQQGNQLAPGNIELNLQNLTELRIRRQGVNILEAPNQDARFIRSSTLNEHAYRLSSQDGWYEVYLPAGHTLGFVLASSAASVDRPQSASTAAPINDAPKSRYPARPSKVPGKTSCRTNCTNGDCYRTYDSGKQTHFQADRTYDLFRSEWVWDSGSC